MTVSLDPVTKLLLNNYFKTQPALNIVGDPATISGIQLGTIIENSLNAPKPAMDATTTKLLNDFSKTQPALNIVGVPAAKSGIKLGDIINQALTQTANYLVTVTSPSHHLGNISNITISAGSNAHVNGSHQVIKTGSNTFTFNVNATPSATGTLTYTLGKTGVAYTSTGAGPWVVTVTSANHGLATGAVVTVANATDVDLDITQTITVTGPNTFTFSENISDPTTGTLDWSLSAAGVAYAAKTIIDPVTIKYLNDFQKTQPALQKPGVPAAKAGIMLGDLIEFALNSL